MKRTFMTGAAAAMLVLLSGCGGGGGGGSSSGGNANDPNAPGGTGTTNTVTGPVIQIRNVMTALYADGQTFAKQDNVINGATFGVVVSYNRAPDSLFEGALTNTENITRTVTKDNVTYAPYVDTQQTDYFRLAPSFAILGRFLPNQPAAKYYVTDQASIKALPETGKPGDAEPAFYTSVIYDSPTSRNKIGTSTQSWTVVADGPSTTRAIFCINSTANVAGFAAKTTQDCYRIDNTTNPNKIVSNFFTVPGA